MSSLSRYHAGHRLRSASFAGVQRRLTRTTGLSVRMECSEVKCPKSTTTHIGWLTAGVVPPEYIPQMMWEMACTERKFADFLSYDPRIEDPALQTFCVRLEFDEVLAKMRL